VQILTGPGDTDALKAAGVSSTQRDLYMRRQREQAEAAAKASPAAPPGPSKGDPSKGLLPTPGGPQGPAPGQSREDFLAGLNPVERELFNLYELQGRPRPMGGGGGGPAKTVMVQTGQGVAGIADVDPKALAALRGARGRAGSLDKAAAEVEGKVAQRGAELGLTAAEQRAQAQAQLEQLDQAQRQALGGIRDQVGMLAQRVAASEVDPDRLWRDAGSAKRGGFLAAAVLSGIGAAIAGKGGGANPALEGLFRVMDRDNAAQAARAQDARAKLNDAQQLYKFTADAYGSEKAATHAMMMGRLEALKAQLDAEAEQLRARATVPGSTINLRLEQAKAQIDQKMALEEVQLEKELNGQISKSFAFKTVGGGGGGGPSLASVIKAKEQQNKLLTEAQERAGKGQKDAKAVFVDGQPLMANPAASQGSVDKAQDMIFAADNGLDTVKALQARARTAGGMVPGDPALKIAANNVGSLLANASGGGAPNDAQLKLAEDAVTPGPRQQAAMDEIERQFRGAKTRAVQRVGAAK
jgi:hypothetical protein